MKNPVQLSTVIRPIVISTLGALLLLGCSQNKTYQIPNLSLPEFSQQAAQQSGSGLPVSMSVWWQMLQQTELNALIDRALANNADLKIASLRMAQAKTQFEQARAGLLPEIKAPVNLGLGTNSGAALSGTWKLDAWGEQRSSVDAAHFVLWQAIYERDEQQRNLVAKVIDSYLQLLWLNDRIRTSQQQEMLLDEMLSVIQQRMELGDASTLELDQMLSNLYNARAEIPNLQEQRSQLLISLSGLLGTVPSELQLSEQGMDILRFPNQLPSLNSSLLLQRPDVRVAEARLLASDANIEVARAQVLPSIDMSAQIGSTLSLSQLFDPTALFARALASITFNIFNRGKLQQQLERNKLIQEEMVESYAKTLYQSVREVESALVSLEKNRRRLIFQQGVARSAKRSWDHVAEMNKIGTLDYLSLLESEKIYLRSLDETNRLQFEVNRAYANLFQSLGGGVGIESAPPQNTKNASNHRTNSDATPQDGIDWNDSQMESFWLLELPGIYQQHNVAPVWRDLRTRFPNEMSQRFVRPKLLDQAENKEQQVSWYRLYLGKFNSAKAAEDTCTTLKRQYQRCRVVSSASISNTSSLTPKHNTDPYNQ